MRRMKGTRASILRASIAGTLIGAMLSLPAAPTFAFGGGPPKPSKEARAQQAQAMRVFRQGFEQARTVESKVTHQDGKTFVHKPVNEVFQKLKSQRGLTTLKGLPEYLLKPQVLMGAFGLVATFGLPAIGLVGSAPLFFKALSLLSIPTMAMSMKQTRAARQLRTVETQAETLGLVEQAYRGKVSFIAHPLTRGLAAGILSQRGERTRQQHESVLLQENGLARQRQYDEGLQRSLVGVGNLQELVIKEALAPAAPPVAPPVATAAPKLLTGPSTPAVPQIAETSSLKGTEKGPSVSAPTGMGFIDLSELNRPPAARQELHLF